MCKYNEQNKKWIENIRFKSRKVNGYKNKIKKTIKIEPNSTTEIVTKVEPLTTKEDNLETTDTGVRRVEANKMTLTKQEDNFNPKYNTQMLENNASKLGANIPIPSSFNKVLKRDHDFLNVEKLSYNLPFKWTIKRILDEFVKTGKTRSERSEYLEYGRTIKTFFDLSLENKLLYPTERSQYERLNPEQKSDPCSVYGGVHLLRLFTKFCGLLEQCKHLDQVHVDETAATTKKFFEFLETNKQTFF